MELRHFRYFIAVAEALSFTRAAQRLHTSQPSLSEQIRNLENEIGLRLLKRTRRKVELTDAGHVFLEEARLVIRQAEEALARTRRAAQQAVETLTIGFVPSAEVWIFPTALTELRLRFPTVSIILRSLTSGELERALATGEVDIAFLRPPARDTIPHSEVVLIEPIRVYLRADHPLAGEDRIDPRTLNHLRFVGIDRDHAASLHDMIEAYMVRHRIQPDDVQISSNVLMSMNLVASGFDYTLLPAYAETFCPKNVVARPLTGRNPEMPLIMASAQDESTASEAARSLMHLVRKLSVTIP